MAFEDFFSDVAPKSQSEDFFGDVYKREPETDFFSDIKPKDAKIDTREESVEDIRKGLREQDKFAPIQTGLLGGVSTKVGEEKRREEEAAAAGKEYFWGQTWKDIKGAPRSVASAFTERITALPYDLADLFTRMGSGMSTEAFLYNPEMTAEDVGTIREGIEKGIEAESLKEVTKPIKGIKEVGEKVAQKISPKDMNPLAKKYFEGVGALAADLIPLGRFTKTLGPVRGLATYNALQGLSKADLEETVKGAALGGLIGAHGKLVDKLTPGLQKGLASLGGSLGIGGLSVAERGVIEGNWELTRDDIAAGLLDLAMTWGEAKASKKRTMSEANIDQGVAQDKFPLQPRVPSKFTKNWRNQEQFIENVGADLDASLKKQGVRLNPIDNAKLRIISHRGVGSKAHSVFTAGPFTYNPDGTTRTYGEGFRDIYRDYSNKIETVSGSKEKAELLSDYYEAARIKFDLEPRDKASPEDIKRADDIMERVIGEHGQDLPVLEEALMRKNKFNHNLLEMLVDEGVLSREKADLFIKENPNYVNFERIDDEVAGKRRRGGRKKIGRVKGSEKPLRNTVESTMKDIYGTVKLADANGTLRAVIDNGLAFEGLVKKVDRKIKPIELSPSEIAKMGSTVDEARIFRPKDIRLGDREVLLYRDGKPEVYELSPEYYDAYRGLDRNSAGVFDKIFKKATGILKTGATATPEFALRNFIRDNFSAMIQTDVGHVPMVDSVGAVADVIGLSDTYQNYMRSGAGLAGFVDMNRGSLKKVIKEMKTSGALGKIAGSLNPLKTVENFKEISGILEESTRVGIFKKAIERGMSPLEAQAVSRESTIDFARGGSKAKRLNDTVAFFNAGAQGIDRVARAWKNNPKAFAAKAIASVTIPELIFYSLNRDDLDYENIPRWQKDLFWIMPEVNGVRVRIPKPFVIGQIFGSSLGRFLEYTDGEDPNALDGALNSLAQSMSPVSMEGSFLDMLPTAIKPLIETYTNWSLFKGREIYPKYKEKLEPGMRANKYTPEVLNEIGSLLNVSPADMEQLISGYGGSVGRYAVEGINSALTNTGIIPKRKSLKEAADIPFLRGFLLRDPISNPEKVNIFYDIREDVEQKYNTWKGLKGPEKLAYLDGNPALEKNYKTLDKIGKRLSQLNKLIDVTINSNLPEAKKRAKVEEYQRKKLYFANQGLMLPGLNKPKPFEPEGFLRIFQ